MSYDYLIVGAGLFGCVFAYEMNKAGAKVLVIDRRPHIGGNIYTEKTEGIHIHKYGPHIFHCNDERIWRYVNQFASFNDYRHRVLASVDGRHYHLPISLQTFRQLWGVDSKEAAEKMLEQVKIKLDRPAKTVEEYALSQVGPEVYEKFIKGYSKKQWGADPSVLPARILSRLCFTTEETAYWCNDHYQGIPIGGYSQIAEKMLGGVDVRLNTDFKEIKSNWRKLGRKVVFSGRPDELLDYRYGEVPYRSLRWETQRLAGTFQQVAQVNHAGLDVAFTRTIEHKHFEATTCDHTFVSYEYPVPAAEGNDPFYPVENEENTALVKKYVNDVHQEYPGIIMGGRLADYRYYDMHQVIARSLQLVRKELPK